MHSLYLNGLNRSSNSIKVTFCAQRWNLQRTGVQIECCDDLKPCWRSQIASAAFIWIAAEAQVVKTLRAHVLEHHRHPLAWLKAAGYWVQGEAGH